MDLGQWAINEGRRALSKRHWASGSGKGRRAMGGGPWAVGHGRFTMGEDGNTGGRDNDVLGEAGVSNKGSAGL